MPSAAVIAPPPPPPSVTPTWTPATGPFASVTVPWNVPYPGASQLGNLNEPTRVCQFESPGTPTYICVNQNVQSSTGSISMLL